MKIMVLDFKSRFVFVGAGVLLVFGLFAGLTWYFLNSSEEDTSLYVITAAISSIDGELFRVRGFLHNDAGEIINAELKEEDFDIFIPSNLMVVRKTFTPPGDGSVFYPEKIAQSQNVESAMIEKDFKTVKAQIWITADVVKNKKRWLPTKLEYMFPTN